MGPPVFLVGSLGFEPRLPTLWTDSSIPQAGILDQSSTKSAEIPAYKVKLDYDPAQQTQTENLIINTIIYAKAEGKAHNTLVSIDHSLRQLSKKHATIFTILVETAAEGEELHK
jgi:hypothetical protein